MAVFDFYRRAVFMFRGVSLDGRQQDVP